MSWSLSKTKNRHTLSQEKRTPSRTSKLRSGLTTTLPREIMRNNGQGRDDDVPASDAGLLMTSPRSGDDAASSFPNVARSSGEAVTRTNAQCGGALQSSSNSLDSEMPNPDHARHAPALRLWPLAVLVFYSESQRYCVLEYVFTHRCAQEDTATRPHTFPTITSGC